MKRCAAVLLATVMLLAGCGERIEPAESEGMRIVALAPNVAEILFELGLGDQVVGVSRFTTYPPEAATRPPVGGTYDPNYERILSLRPDMVIGLDSQQEIAQQLDQLGIAFLGVPHERVADILEAIRRIGQYGGVEEEAYQIIKRISRRIDAAEKYIRAAQDRPPPRILACVGHDEPFSRLYVAGKNTLYDDLIRLAGGINACEITLQPYPEVSREGVSAMKPDLILLIAPGQTVREPIHRMPFPVVLLTNEYVSVPGPRIDKLLDDLVQILHYAANP